MIVLNKFNEISGLKLNKKKTKAIWIGSTKNFRTKPFGFQPYQEMIMLLGVNLSYNQDRNNNLYFFVKIHKMDTKLNMWQTRDLRACPREHREVVLHGISPISMKRCQFKGSTPKHKKTNWFLFWFFPGGDRPPPPVFPWFSPRKSLQVKCMKLSLRWYLTNYSECLHTFLHP